MSYFFTSDTHYGHKALIKYCDRPFFGTKEMNETMVIRWNEVVSPEDIVFHLGDFSFLSANSTVQILEQLNGKKILIRGNHDRKMKPRVKAMFTEIHDVYRLTIQHPFRQLIVMCHFPWETWEKSHHGSWHLHGHSHGSLPAGDRRRLDVGVDSHDFYPWSLDQIITHFGAND